MAEEQKMFTVGPPPHWRAKNSVHQMNYAFILALAPAALIGAIAYSFGDDAITHVGWGGGLWTDFLRLMVDEFGVPAGVLNLAGPLGLLALGAGLGLTAEYAIQVAFRQPYHATNGHGALMGLIVAMLLPPTVPWWVLVVGVVVAILIGKQIYGGIGSYPFHPALVGWLIVLLSWQNHVYPVGMESIAAMHWVAIYVTAMGGLALVALGHINYRTPIAVILGVVIGSVAFYLITPENALWAQRNFQLSLSSGTPLLSFKLGAGSPITQLITGHVMLAAFFLSTDTTSSPANSIPQWLFGIGVGVTIMLIRTYGVWPDAVPFAVMLMNVLSPLLDKIRPRPVKVVMQDA